MGSKHYDLSDWTPTRISLDAQLMRDVIDIACSNLTEEPFTTSLSEKMIHWSLAPPSRRGNVQKSIIQISGADSPNVVVNTADGGQSAPTISMTVISVTSFADTEAESSGLRASQTNEPQGTTPLPWDYNSQSLSLSGPEIVFDTSIGGPENFAWWDMDEL